MNKKTDQSANEAAFELPASIREAAEKSLDQSRQAYDKFKGAAEEAATVLEDQAQLVADNTAELNLKTLSFAESNIASTFDLARKLLGTKDLNEAVELQVAFARKQIEALGGQAKEISELSTKAATEASKPYSAQMEKAMSEFKDGFPS